MEYKSYEIIKEVSKDWDREKVKEVVTVTYTAMPLINLFGRKIKKEPIATIYCLCLIFILLSSVIVFAVSVFYGKILLCLFCLLFCGVNFIFDEREEIDFGYSKLSDIKKEIDYWEKERK